MNDLITHDRPQNGETPKIQEGHLEVALFHASSSFREMKGQQILPIFQCQEASCTEQLRDLDHVRGSCRLCKRLLFEQG